MDLNSKIEAFASLQKPLRQSADAALKKLGLNTARDLLFYFPYRYLDFSKVSTIKDLQAGENVSLRGTIKSIGSRFSFRGRMSLAEAVVSDETGSIKIVWFNQPYLAKNLKKGDEIFLAGAAEYYKQGLQLVNPIYEKASDFPVHTSRLVPVYHLTAGLYPKSLRNLMATVMHLSGRVEESLPPEIIKNQNLPTLPETIQFSHFPEDKQQIKTAQTRLAFEEIFINQLAAQKHRLELEQKQSFKIKFNQKLIKGFVDCLPFKLTPGQKAASWEILQDLEKPMPMNRLLEADVGSGKTVVALMAALQAAAEDYQVSLLSPTEILAKQHYKTAKKYLVDQKIHVELLTNAYSELDGKTETKDKLQKLISEGMPGLFIGTHALLAEKVKFKKLALIIIDEQHRFGVEQRARLFAKTKKVPHLLSLTATPIPRTLRLAYYGELSISQIKSRPAGRKIIQTKLVNQADRAKAYQFIAQEIRNGRQIFVITPLIEESETLEVKSAKTEFENLRKLFPKNNIGLLHGKLKSADKEQAMADFLNKKTDILVATSVVEVGVDVPNASVMVIEGAERFGLAQLHQFRGRVGRAEHQSYCLLFTQKEDPAILERLTAFSKTFDGFALAELDLKQRGFGELYGGKQSGWNFKFFNPSYVELIKPAREEAIKLLKTDLELKTYSILARQIKDKVVHFE
jgi:ATP-dependent DNA helicase RecG